jgi:hypothetical protein
VSQYLSGELRERPQVDVELELGALLVEVLVELAANGVERTRGAEDAGAERSRKPIELALGVRIERDLAEPEVAGRDEQRAHRSLGEVVDDVQESLGGGSLPETLVECS